jgi:hypothetical protein
MIASLAISQNPSKILVSRYYKGLGFKDLFCSCCSSSAIFFLTSSCDAIIHIIANYFGEACFQFPSLEERKKKKEQRKILSRRNGHRNGLTSEASRLHLPGPLLILSRKSTFFFLSFCSCSVFC